MTLDQLKYLIEISNNPSINEASKKLHISFQALSHSMKSLEKELGFPLLKSTNKGTILTNEGVELVSLGKNFINNLLTMQSNYRYSHNDQASISGNIHFATSSICLEYFLFDTIIKLKKLYPNLTFDYTTDLSKSKFLKQLKEDPTSFAICFLGFLSTETTSYPDDFQVIELYSSDIKCLCSPLHELSQFQNVSISQLKKYNLLVRNSNVYNEIRQELRTGQHIFVESNPLLFEQRIASGEYFALAYKVPFAPFWIPPLHNTTKVNIKTDNSVKLQLIYAKNFEMTPQTSVFLNHIFEKVGYDKQSGPLADLL